MDLTLSAMAAVPGLDAAAVRAVESILSVLRVSIPIFRAVGAALRGASVTRLLKLLSRELQGLAPGRALLVPAGWRVPNGDDVEQFDFVVLVEATSTLGTAVAGVVCCLFGQSSTLPSSSL